MPDSASPPTGAESGSVRTTVDLTRAEHRSLRDLCNDYADELGVTRVAGRQVVRELIAELIANQELRKRIRDRLAGRASNG
ncbi:hypothetical protein AB0F93_03530 [Micromonospora tulbaghiae]|uniref:hypothetical protein n=1 Tax=Micromonospora tulbaghiae TaxID=479978 RepID=UPI00331BFFF9